MEIELEELMVNYTSLKSNINKLKKVSSGLGYISNVSSSFASSSGSAKDALEKELTSIKAAGVAYKAAVDDLISDLEMAEKRFKDMDSRLSDIYKS